MLFSEARDYIQNVLHNTTHLHSPREGTRHLFFFYRCSGEMDKFVSDLSERLLSRAPSKPGATVTTGEDSM